MSSGRAFCHDPAAAVAAFGAEIENPVGGLDDFQVVLDHHDRVALVHQGVEDFQQFADVLEMQAGGGFVEDVEGAAGGAAGQFLGQLDALRFAAGQGGRLLPERDVAEADLLEDFEPVVDARLGAEVGDGFVHRHRQDLGDGFVAEFDLQCFSIVAFSLARVAGDIDVGQEVHLDFQQAVALAGLAAAALDVEAETARACSRGRGLPAVRRTSRGSGRTGRCRWRGWTAACGRSATGRCR